MESHMYLDFSQLIPDYTSSVCDTHLFYHHFNSGLLRLPTSLVIIIPSSHYFAEKHVIAPHYLKTYAKSPQSDIQEPLHLPPPLYANPTELLTAISKFSVFFGL